MFWIGAMASARAESLHDFSPPVPVAVSIESSPPDGRDAYPIGETIPVGPTPSPAVPAAGNFLAVAYMEPVQASAQSIRDTVGDAAASFGSDWYAEQPEAVDRASRAAREPRVAEKQRIGDILAQKARRTPAQRKVSSQLLDARRAQVREPATTAEPDHRQTMEAGAMDERVMVDIRADVTPAVLRRIRALGGTVINNVPKYRAIRAELPLAAVVRLAALSAVQSIRPADEAVTRQDDTTEGDVAHRANLARRTHDVDGTGIGIGVISAGVRSLADRQATGDLPARVTVLPGQAGRGDEGTALLEIVHDLAPGAELYFATGHGGQAQMAENIEALCEAGANVIVDDIGYTLEAAFQDDIVSKGVNAAVTDGCYFFSAGGNDGNLTYGTTGVWEGDYAAGTSLIVDGETLGVRHDFGGGMEANEVSGFRVSAIVLQWADPLGASANDYDLFLVNEDGDVIASSTDTQDGTQDPIESIFSPFFNFSGLRLVVVKTSGSDRYLRVHAFDGRLAIQTAGNMYGHPAAENAIGVAMVDVRGAGPGDVFNGNESVRRGNSDGPRRMFFEPDGAAITAGNFSSTGGELLQKPDLAAATCVTTATPGFSTFCGTSAAAPHAAAIGALMLEAAGGPNEVTLARLRKGMTSGTAVLDIEAAGDWDRDSGAGIVMAPGAVTAVAVAETGRNRAPTVENAVSDRTFASGADAVTIDLEDVFGDPDDGTLTYDAISSDPDRLAVTRNGSMVTITPGSPGRAVVTLRAIDPDGLSATDAFSVTVAAGNTDYDDDDDGFIDVGTLAQLDAMRYDLDGDGLVDGATWEPYYTAYPMGVLGMGCPSDGGCTGYELTAELDFDTDDDGDVDSDDDYWNGGDGWDPIGEADAPFIADFKGNRRTVSNLFIDRDNEDEVGLFGTVDSSRISGVTLAGANVTGRHAVGSLRGNSIYGTVIDSHATGQVSGQDEVGGLVGRTWGTVWYSSAAVNVSGNDAVGGLVGHQTLNATVASYATGNVEGKNAVGGLVGAVSEASQVIEASYATGNVSGTGSRLAESDSGFIICDLLGVFTPSGPLETTTSTGGGVGGLVGSSCGYVQASYATGEVSGTAAVGGLVGSGRFVKAQSSYWDLETSGVRAGVGEDDANDNGVIDGSERLRLGVGGKSTAELQAPTDYTGIYAAWNVELGDPFFDDGEPDDPWDFGTATQYPVLSLDLNDDNRATWQEFGYQVRDGLTLTAATTASQAQVVLSWNAISIPSSWSPAPDVSYTLYRDDGATVEAVQTDLTGLTHTDTDVTIGDRYTYWVAAVLDGGEAARSAPVSVTAGGANQAPLAVGILPDRQLTVGSMAVDVDVAAAFQDPDNDTLTYGASSSLTSVATSSRSGSVVTITPGTAGRAIITVTATDVSGSGMVASQRFSVTVGNDYDTDGDGLIGISNLAQLDAMRHDLDGNGYAGTVAANVAAYAAAFPSPLDRMCSGVNGCSGYELLADLDFDTDGDGAVDSDDDYWNDGDGWVPIGWDSTYEFPFFFNATFDGNEHTLSNLFTAGRAYSGLFGRIGLDGEVRELALSDVNVSGTEAAGALVGENQGLLIGIRSSGQVSGERHVGGLVGLNLRLVYLSRSSAAVTGMRPPLPPDTGIVVTFEVPPATGGLVGYNTGFVVYSYATGPVTSDSNAGGLVGYHQSKLIAASYATGPVSGSSAGGLVGTVATPRSEATIMASYATGSVDGGTAGGLVGHLYDEGTITASYATGRVAGSRTGGLVGDDERGTVTSSYWDTRTSGQGSGSPGSGRTTAQLQSPGSYSGIYGSWNVDLNDDGTNNDPWHFETGKYPALKADMDGDDDATWEEFGYQLRSGPTLTATPATSAGQSQVELEWTEVPLSSAWSPAPGVSYAVTREDDEDLETIAENLTVLDYTDTDVAGETYIYQVVAVVDGGEPVRSATASVTVAGNKRPVAVDRLRWRTLLVGDSAMTEVGGAFQDPEGDTITYAVSSSDPSVARVTLSGTRVTIIPVAEGRAIITVTATDDGSNRSRTQQFGVRVRPTTTVDYDTDDDGLIEIRNLAQLDAVRYDNEGRGSGLVTAHREAFTDGGGGALACGGLLGCVGYELLANLDFDTDGDGTVDSDDDYWNNGAGWMPIKTPTIGSITPYAAIFEGNGHTITNLFIDSSENDIGLFGETTSSAVIRNLELVAVQVTGTDNVGGLVGSNRGAVSGCYATGKVSGDDDVGGLVGANLDDGSVSAGYSTVQVTGDDRIGGVAGSNSGEVTAAYATGRVVGDFEAGGLIGRNSGDVNVSYATGLVSGRSTIGGLIGRNASGGAVTDSYWDTTTSGHITGVEGRTNAQLQAPTDYTGIYAAWNVDLDGDGTSNSPWDFGGSGDYPALKADPDGDGTGSWKEFGYQLRAGPTLTAATDSGQPVLTWTAVDAGDWTPEPTVVYTVIRDDGTDLEAIASGLETRTHTDGTASEGATYDYQVAAGAGVGEAVRSSIVEVTVTVPDGPPAVNSIESDAAHPTKDPFNVTITFSESVADLTGSEIEVANGAGSNFSGSGSTYRLRVTPDADYEGNVTVTVPAGVVEDRSMNPNEAGSATFAVDTLAPALAAANGAAVSGATLTLTFDEALGAANVATSAFTVTGATTRSVTGVSVTGTTVRLTLSVPALHGEAGIEVDYDPPSREPIVDVAGNRAASIADRSVTNNTPATTLSRVVRLTMNEAQVAEAGPAKTVTVTGMLDRAGRPSATTLTIEVGAGTDTATEGSDYATVGALTLTIPAYSTSGRTSFTLTPMNDRIDESSESLTVRGSTSVSGLIVTPTGGLSIGLSDNDPAPSLGLSVDQSSFGEDGGTATVTVSTGSGSTFATAQTVQLSVAGTATETTDYTISGKTLTLPAGAGTTASMVTATLTGVDDDLDDDGETVVVSGTHNGVAFGDRRTVTVEDDDDPEVTVSFAQAGYRAAEGGHVDVAVTLSAVPERQVSIPVEAEGADGADSADFSISPSSLSFGANETTRTVRVSAANDSAVDPGESVALSFGTTLPERISEGGIAETTVAIRDTDFTFAPAFAAGAGTTESDADTYTVSEASSALRLSLTLETPRGARVVDIVDPVVVTLATRENAGGREADEDYATRRRSGTFGDYGELDLDLSFAPGDFSDDGNCGCARARKAVSVDLFNDRVYERTEVFGLRLARKSGRLSVSSQDVTAKIAEDDAEPALTLDANPARIAEAGGTSTVTVSTGAGSTFPSAQTIRLELGGTATRGADYTIDSTSLTLPAGMGENPSTVSTTVRALDDPFDDNAETVALSATRDGVEFASRAVAIADDDIGSTRVDLAVNPAQVREDAGATTVRVTATLDAAARAEDTALSVTVGSAGDSAVEGTDYATVPDLTLTIDAGETMAETTFRLAPTNNDSVEGARTITVDGSVPGLAVRSVDLTLNDDDVASTNVTLTLDPREVRESAGSRTVRVTGTLDGGARPTATVVAVTVGTGGDSATEGTDYAEVPELELTIPANRTDGTVTFTLRPTNDRTAEGTETISVRGDVAELTVTPAELAIVDDDTASTRLDLSLNPSTVSEAAVPTEVVVTGSLDAGARATDSTVTVTVGASGDSATEGSDYAFVSTLAITIPANETTGQTTFTLRPQNDAIAEGAETITVGGRASGLTVEPATLTLSDDDRASRVVTLSVAPASVSEDAPEDVTVTAALDAGARAEDTAVRLTVGAAGDTAVPGTDYKPVSERTLTILSGETGGTAVFRLEPLDNDSSDGARTLSVTGSTTVAELRIEPASGARIALADDDSPAVLVMPDTLTVVEAASVTYTVELQTRPTADVTVTITGVSGDLSLDRTSLVFTGADWRDPRDVRVTAADDADSVRDAAVTLTHRASGAAEYRGLRADLVVSIRENDPGLVFSESALRVREGQTATYTVALATLPTADVTVRVTGEFGDLSLDKTQLAFTPGDWDDAQTITVEAAEDNDTSTDPAVTLTHQASGGGYDGIVGSVQVSVTENDGGGGTGGGGSGGGAANRPPVVEREIEDQTLDAGEVLELDIRLNFYDRDQRALDYTAESADRSVATVAVDRHGVLTIRGIARGVTAITVTAADRRDERVSQAFAVTVRGPFLVGLFPRASDAVREGFVRVINRSLEAGEVTIEATDDAGTRLGPVTLSVAAGATAHFNSNDLEQGNASKGLPSGVGSAEGDWRLELTSALEIEVLSYIRTADGFLTSMHDSAPVAGGVHRVVIFNPGSNPNQVSRLRLLNLGSEEALVRITGIDDAGASPDESVLVAVPAGAAKTVTAVALETGTGGVEDALGDGAGKWRLRVDSDQPIRVMSLLSSPTGHLTNLSTAPDRGGP